MGNVMKKLFHKLLSIFKGAKEPLGNTASSLVHKITEEEITELFSGSTKAAATAGVVVASGSVFWPILVLVAIHAGIGYLKGNKDAKIQKALNLKLDQITNSLPDSFERLWQTELSSLTKIIEVKLNQDKQGKSIDDLKGFCEKIYDDLRNKDLTLRDICNRLKLADEQRRNLSLKIENCFEEINGSLDRLEVGQLGIRDQLSEIKNLLKRLPPGRTYNARIERFIKAYLGSNNEIIPFGGREKELEQLNSWLSNKESPKNLLLTAPAGRGKTALLIKWLEHVTLDWQVIFMPISIRYETNRPIVFYESLAAQLSGILNESLQSTQYEQAEFYKEKVIEYIAKIE